MTTDFEDPGFDEPPLRGWRPRPAASWERLVHGNQRFVAGQPLHPGQDATQRHQLQAGQEPHAMIFGCSDSRVAAEIVFDQGLGDLFVIRTAGHVVDGAVLGSCEFGVSALQIPLLVVLGHDQCGAVAGTLVALGEAGMPKGYVRDIVERVSPSVVAARRQAHPAVPTVEQVEHEHVRQTVALLLERSTVLHEAVTTGRCMVLGATYELSDGLVHPIASAAPGSDVPR